MNWYRYSISSWNSKNSIKVYLIPKENIAAINKSQVPKISIKNSHEKKTIHQQSRNVIWTKQWKFY